MSYGTHFILSTFLKEFMLSEGMKWQENKLYQCFSLKGMELTYC